MLEVEADNATRTSAVDVQYCIVFQNEHVQWTCPARVVSTTNTDRHTTRHAHDGNWAIVTLTQFVDSGWYV